MTTDINLHNAVLEVNVYGTINFTEEMLRNDMINEKGKIICVGSMMGNLNRLNSQKLKQDFKKANTYKDLLCLAALYRDSYTNGTVDKDGWCNNSYCVSKMIVNSYPRILSYREEIIKKDLSVYSAHPGWVKTDMTGPEAPLTIKEGAENEIFLIELPDGINEEYQGKYFDRFKVSSFE